MSAGCWQCDLDIGHVYFHGMRRPGEPIITREPPLPVSRRLSSVRSRRRLSTYEVAQYWDSGGGSKTLATEWTLVTGGTIDGRKPFT